MYENSISTRDNTILFALWSRCQKMSEPNPFAHFYLYNPTYVPICTKSTERRSIPSQTAQNSVRSRKRSSFHCSTQNTIASHKKEDFFSQTYQTQSSIYFQLSAATTPKQAWANQRSKSKRKLPSASKWITVGWTNE